MDTTDEDDPSPLPAVDRKLIRNFREQIHALGALWIIIGSLSVGLAALAFGGHADAAARFAGDERAIFFVIAGLGLVWLILGVLTCLKMMPAVYVALALSYLSLVGQVVNLSLCGVVILIVVILQAHRVIGWSRRMRAAGVPLTTKPPPRPARGQ